MSRFFSYTKKIDTPPSKTPEPVIIEKAQDPFMAFAANQYSFNNNWKENRPLADVFRILRRFSKDYDILRACINVRKNVLTQTAWSIGPIDEKASFNDSVVAEIEDLFNRPFQNKSFRDLLNMMVEDLSTLDAVSLYKHRKNNGRLSSLIPIDAATIRLNVDESGMLAEPPNSAYIQIVDGMEVQTYTMEEMVYEMQNPQTDTPYGLSPVETLITTIESALAVKDYNLTYFKEGTVPPGLVQAAENWTQKQYESYQHFLNDTLSGNTRNLHKLLVVPPGAKYTPIDRRDDMFFKALEDSTMKSTCAMMGVSPSQIGYTDDVNRATAESQEENLRMRTVRPLAQFFEEIFNNIIRDEFEGSDNLCFKFELEKDDMAAKVDMYSRMIPLGALEANEFRQEIGKDPLEENDNEDSNSQNSDDSEDEDDSDEDQDSGQMARKEFITWRKRALRDVKYNKDVSRTFNSQFLNEGLKAEIYKRLEKAETKEDVSSVFSDIGKHSWVYRNEIDAYARLDG